MWLYNEGSAFALVTINGMEGINEWIKGPTNEWIDFNLMKENFTRSRKFPDKNWWSFCT